MGTHSIPRFRSPIPAAAEGFFNKSRKAAIILKAKEFHAVGLSWYRKGGSVSSLRHTFMRR